MKIMLRMALIIGMSISVNVLAEWKVDMSIDQMTGEVSHHFAYSPMVDPMSSMDRPYHDTMSILQYSCYPNSTRHIREKVTLYFSNTPNLNHDKTQDGFNLGNWRIKWGNEPVKRAEFSQNWGSKFLMLWGIQNTTIAVRKMQEHSTFMIELPWHGSGNTVFKYPLVGSAHAIQKARQKCNDMLTEQN